MDQFRNIVYLADRSGTAKWRRVWAIQSIDCVSQGTGIQADYSQSPILDPKYYNGMNSITIQRWIANHHVEIMDKLFKPITERNRSWIVYEIDDLMSDKYIPLFNRGRKAFEGEEIQGNIKHLLDQSDIITVTTDYLKETYHRLYDIPMEKIVALPNFLPRYLFDDRYDIKSKLEQFSKYKAKPRIGIVSSLSHYNIDDVREGKDGRAVRKKTVGTSENGEPIIKWFNEKDEEVPECETKVLNDDMDIIIDCIKETVDEVRWVFFGYCPPKLSELAKNKKIEVHGGSHIMNYPGKMENLQLQAVVAPIQDIEFNRCKSFIKYMECAALGIPLFASNYLPYNRVMDRQQLFNNGSELKEKILKFKFMSTGMYQKIIEKQYKWLNSPCKEGDFTIKNFWMEDNLNIFIDLFRMKNKCINMSLEVYLQKKEEHEKYIKEHTMYSNNGVEILK